MHAEKIIFGILAHVFLRMVNNLASSIDNSVITFDEIINGSANVMSTVSSNFLE